MSYRLEVRKLKTKKKLEALKTLAQAKKSKDKEAQTRVGIKIVILDL